MIRLWLSGTALLLVQGSLWRILFWGLYRRPGLSFTQISEALWLGARFDLTVACYIFSIPLLLFWADRTIGLLPSLESGRGRLRSWITPLLSPYLILMFTLVSLISMIDVGYYSFYQDRLNVILFGFIEDDTWAVVKTIWKNYPVIWITFGMILLLVGQAWSLHRFSRAALSRPATELRPGWRSLAFLGSFFFFLGNGVAARGSLGLFPLSEMDTHISSEDFVNLLSYNPIHALSRAIQNKVKSRARWDSNLDAFGYQGDARRAWADCFHVPPEQVPADPRALMRRKTAPNPWAAKTKPHVVVLVMESFGAYWLRYAQEPFDLVGRLKPVLQGNPHLTTLLSATGATIGSLSSLMAGVPHRPVSDFLTEGMYLGTPVRTSPARIYKRQGYEARFMYAGNPGWRDIAKYARTQGFDTVEGDVDIEKSLGRKLEHHDWGLYDEDMWAHLEKTLREADRPQFVVLMTTANHPPYQLPAGAEKPTLTVPPELQARLIGDHAVAAQRFATYRHSNDMLGDFVARLQAGALGPKTVIAVTGDHNFWIVPFDDGQALIRDAVPFLLIPPPPLKVKFPPDRYGAHADIWPTLYGLTLNDAEYDSAAVDLLDPRQNSAALNYSRIAIGAAGGVYVNGRVAAEDHAYDWDARRESLRPGSMTAAHQALALRYRCLMGLLDDFFHREDQEKHP